jgi:hypothetical protein
MRRLSSRLPGRPALEVREELDQRAPVEEARVRGVDAELVSGANVEVAQSQAVEGMAQLPNDLLGRLALRVGNGRPLGHETLEGQKGTAQLGEVDPGSSLVGETNAVLAGMEVGLLGGAHSLLS